MIVNIKLGRIADQLILVLTIALICSFTVLDVYSWGRYVILMCLVAIFALDSTRNNFRFRLNTGSHFIWMSLWFVFTLASAAWAENAADSISKAKTIFEILVMVCILFNTFYQDEDSVEKCLFVIKWSSYIIVVYAIAFYGIDNLKMVADSAGGLGLENTFANVNVIAMLAAVSVLIEADETLEKKKIKPSVLLTVASVILLALTMSRKAFVMLLAGIVMLLLLRNSEDRDALRKLIKTILGCLVLGVVFYILIQLPIFSGTMKRMQGMISGFLGIGEVDNSTYVRMTMIELGKEQFKKTPLLGMGIGNPHNLVIAHVGKDAYLHNNFIELLAGGGIIGFLVFYSVYVYFFKNYWKYRRRKNLKYNICFTIMVIFLVMDYGRVSYYSKISYIFFLLSFLEINRLKTDERKCEQMKQQEEGGTGWA